MSSDGHVAGRKLTRSMLRSWVLAKPRPMHLLAILLCIALGLALSTQVRSQDADPVGRLSEEELVSLLADLDAREAELYRTSSALEAEIASLEDDQDAAKAAREAAEQARTEALIIAGALAVQGPGVVLRVTPGSTEIPASVFVTTMAELRNAGAEAVSVNDNRLGGRSWFARNDGQIILDGHALEPPYVWTAIGDPHTLSEALDIRGGALAQFSAYGADASVVENPNVEITATVEPLAPKWAQVQDAD